MLPPQAIVQGYTNAIGIEGLIELYRVDIAYKGFIDMRLSVLPSWFSSKEKFSKEQRMASVRFFCFINTRRLFIFPLVPALHSYFCCYAGAKEDIIFEIHKKLLSFLIKQRRKIGVYLTKPRGKTVVFLTKPRGKYMRWLCLFSKQPLVHVYQRLL